jgi:hypothetical protein
MATTLAAIGLALTGITVLAINVMARAEVIIAALEAI